MINKILRRMSAVILEFENMLLIWIGFVPFHHVRRFFYRVAGIRIGKGSTIHTGARFYNPKNIVIGRDSIIGEGAVLDGRAKLTIGDHVDIASEVMIYNSQHNVHEKDFADRETVELGEVVIEDYVFIGPRVIILPGVTLGKGSVAGAGAVVTQDVAENMIVGGVPAKVIGERRTKDHHYKLGRAAWFR